MWNSGLYRTPFHDSSYKGGVPEWSKLTLTIETLNLPFTNGKWRLVESLVQKPIIRRASTPKTASAQYDPYAYLSIRKRTRYSIGSREARRYLISVIRVHYQFYIVCNSLLDFLFTANSDVRKKKITCSVPSEDRPAHLIQFHNSMVVTCPWMCTCFTWNMCTFKDR